jgi:hypothetical protein
VPVSGGDELVKAMIYYCDNLQSERLHEAFRQDFIDRYSPEQVVGVHARALRVAAKEIS